MKTVKVTAKKVKETISEKELKVKIVSFNKMNILNNILEYFETITGLKTITFTDSNFYNNKSITIKISFPVNSKFDVDEAYRYLAYLLYYNDIIFTLDGIDGASLLEGVAKYEVANESMRRSENHTVLSCTISTIKGSVEFDNIICIIEILHDITIDIIRDFSELNSENFHRSVVISIPNEAINDFRKIIDRKDFINFDK